MTVPTVAALPAAPNRTDPATFSSRSDTFVGALPTFRTEIVALADYLETLATATGPGLFLDGAAATPSISYASDTDTGLYRSAANTIGLATGGTARALMSTTAFQIDLPVTGTAVMTDADDTTAGRLMDVGAFGLGDYARMPPSTDYDLATVCGFFRNNSGGLNKPTGSNHSMLNMPHSGSLHAQLAVCLNTAASYINRVYIRTKSGASTWHDWEAVHTARSILGTVSQSGGVPTGAVVETGSNANGRYTRLADGTQICWLSVAASAGAAVTWTFPAAFSAAPAVTGGAQATVLSCVVFDSAPTTTAVTFSARDKTDARRADTCTLRAEGRWF